MENRERHNAMKRRGAPGWTGPRGDTGWAYWARYAGSGDIGHEETPACSRRVPGEGFYRSYRERKATAWRRRWAQVRS